MMSSPMLGTLEELAQFLLKYAPLIGEIYSALEVGASEDAIKKAIRDAKVAAADEAAKAIVGMGP